MKVKISITLSDSIFELLAPFEKDYTNRSDLIEQAIIYFIHTQGHKPCEARDLEILNRISKELNNEAAEVLSYQVKK